MERRLVDLECLCSISTVVRKALEAALLRILTPKKSTDVLREILEAKAAGRAYSIVFVGVNGVGKSTSLSKVCYYLKSKGVKVRCLCIYTFEQSTSSNKDDAWYAACFFWL